MDLVRSHFFAQAVQFASCCTLCGPSKIYRFAMTFYRNSPLSSVGSRRQRRTYGYQPQRLTENQLKRTEIALNTELDTNEFLFKYNEVVPDYWPMHADGHLVRHIYLLIDAVSYTHLTLPTKRIV